MKRVIIILLCFMIAGCGSKLDIDKKEYNQLIKEIKAMKKMSVNEMCDINIYLDKLTDDEVMFRLVIDNPKQEMHNIKAIVIHNKPTDDIFPSSGIFEPTLNLIPDVADASNNNPLGIILIGYIPYDKAIDTLKIEFKGIIKYQNKDNVEKVLYFSRQI